MEITSVADPDPSDPYQYHLPGSVSKVGLDPDPTKLLKTEN